MRSSIAVAAGLAAAASAHTYTTTATADVTVTSCSPTHTNCPYKPESGHWEDWSTSEPVDPTTTSTASWEDWSTSTPVDPTTTSTVSWEDWSTTSSDPADVTTTSYSWGDWESTSSTPADETTTSSCPMYTSTAPPAWFSYLPSDVKSSIEAKWTGAPPADWCYYTYSTAVATSTPAWAASSGSPVSPAEGTGAWTYSGSPVSPSIAAYTGAASSNTGNIVVAGLAAVAAMVIA